MPSTPVERRAMLGKLTSPSGQLVRVALNLGATVLLLLIVMALRYEAEPPAWAFVPLTFVSAGWLATDALIRRTEIH